MPSPQPYRSKTVAAWLTLALGALGLHRLYLYGRRDRVVWAYPLPTLLGLVGVQRLLALGQNDLEWYRYRGAISGRPCSRHIHVDDRQYQYPNDHNHTARHVECFWHRGYCHDRSLQRNN